ncbi:MAG: hypothetical protein C0433_16630 [Cyclobacterium sp.]|nr:hypothetical protein [Cyclobacterium sp.]
MAYPDALGVQNLGGARRANRVDPCLEMDAGNVRLRSISGNFFREIFKIGLLGLLIFGKNKDIVRC